jgi:hypothetical protein
MTLTQTVDITADRRVRFDFEVPREIPEGRTLFEFKVIPFVNKEEKLADNKKIRFTRKELDEMLKNSPITQKLSGILSELRDADLDEIRYKALAEKHLK